MQWNPYWLIDDGHGWLVVPLEAVVTSGAEITRFSYVSPDGHLAYLEEDCDARAFLEAAQIDGATAAKWPVERVKRARCREHVSFAPESLQIAGLSPGAPLRE